MEEIDSKLWFQYRIFGPPEDCLCGFGARDDFSSFFFLSRQDKKDIIFLVEVFFSELCSLEAFDVFLLSLLVYFEVFLMFIGAKVCN